MSIFDLLKEQQQQQQQQEFLRINIEKNRIIISNINYYSTNYRKSNSTMTPLTMLVVDDDDEDEDEDDPKKFL